MPCHSKNIDAKNTYTQIHTEQLIFIGVETFFSERRGLVELFILTKYNFFLVVYLN